MTSRQARKVVAAETVRIMRDGVYESAGAQVSVGEAIQRSKDATVLAIDGVPGPSNARHHDATHIRVTSETTLAAARRLREELGSEARIGQFVDWVIFFFGSFVLLVRHKSSMTWCCLPLADSMSSCFLFTDGFTSHHRVCSSLACLVT